MGNKSKFRTATNEEGEPAKLPKWRNHRDMVSRSLPKSKRSWMGMGAPCAADLVNRRNEATMSEIANGFPGRIVHFRRALPVLWNSSKAGTFRNAKPLNSQVGQ